MSGVVKNVVKIKKDQAEAINMEDEDDFSSDKEEVHMNDDDDFSSDENKRENKKETDQSSSSSDEK